MSATDPKPLRLTDGLAVQIAAAILLGGDRVAGGRSDRRVARPVRGVLAVHGAGRAVRPPDVCLGGMASRTVPRSWTRRFGDRALTVFGVGFFILFGLRPVTIIALAVADHGTLWEASPSPWLAAVVLATPAVWTLYSVVRWFSVRRALGVDHFEPGFNEQLVRRGAFAGYPTPCIHWRSCCCGPSRSRRLWRDPRSLGLPSTS